MSVSEIPKELLSEENLLRSIPSTMNYRTALKRTERQLELRQIGEGHYIASNHSIILGDVPFLKEASKEIAEKVKKLYPEVVLTAESKSIYLAGKVTETLGLDRFEVCRKSVKSYNVDPISVKISSTISGEERLFLDRSSMPMIKGKRVVLVDDVVTTGGNMIGMDRLASLAGGKVVAKACIWVEGVPMNEAGLSARKGLVYLSTLPEFFDKRRLLSARRKFKRFLKRSGLNQKVRP